MCLRQQKTSCPGCVQEDRRSVFCCCSQEPSGKGHLVVGGGQAASPGWPCSHAQGHCSCTLSTTGSSCPSGGWNALLMPPSPLRVGHFSAPPLTLSQLPWDQVGLQVRKRERRKGGCSLVSRVTRAVLSWPAWTPLALLFEFSSLGGGQASDLAMCAQRIPLSNGAVWPLRGGAWASCAGCVHFVTAVPGAPEGWTRRRRIVWLAVSEASPWTADRMLWAQVRLDLWAEGCPGGRQLRSGQQEAERGSAPQGQNRNPRARPQGPACSRHTYGPPAAAQVLCVLDQCTEDVTPLTAPSFPLNSLAWPHT